MTTRIPGALVSVLGPTIDHVDEAALEQLVGLMENSSLDVKSYMYEDSKNLELAKDVVAFANHAGGVLVIGAIEKNEIIDALRPIETAGAELRIRNVLQRRVSPFLPGVGVAVVPSSANSDEGYVVIVIEPSPARPHAIVEKEDLRFPIRDGSSTRYMHMAEIRGSLIAGQRDARERRQFAAELFDSVKGQQTEDEKGDIWIAMSAVPSLPGRLSISRSSLDELKAKQRQDVSQLPYDNGWSTAEVTTGNGRFIIGDFRTERYNADWGGVRFAYADLFERGEVAITAKIPVKVEKDDPVARVLHTSVLVQVVNLLVITGQHLRRTAAGGSLDIQIGLNSELPIEVGTNHMGAQPLHSSRYQRTDSCASLTLMSDDISVAGPSLVASAFVAGSALMHEFGVPEVLGASSDGALRDSYTAREWKQYLTRWAKKHGVEYG